MNGGLDPTFPERSAQGAGGRGGAADDADSPEVTHADRRMADLLSAEGGTRELTDAVRTLRSDDDGDAADLLSRLNALDYLDALVGEVGGGLPERLGDFRLVGLLGRGGMGTVFEAFQETLERYVAVKVLSPTLTSDPRMRKRFRTEARASATLHHQHIVPVYGFGESQGYLFFAMERVEGISLDKHIARARRSGERMMSPREMAGRFAGVADALHHAHRRGVLHRDVKPGNLLVHPEGDLALADFGLSKIAGEHSASFSRGDGFLGTLHYAAPEQAIGREHTPRCDLYSLGATLYECLTGRLPIEADSTEALLHGIVHGAPPPPLRRLVPDAPRDLEAVLLRLLARDPEDRYPDGEALARDLQRVADDEPVLIRRVPWTRRAARWVRSRPSLSSALAVVVILSVTLGIFWTELRDEEQQGRAARRDNLLREAVLAAETMPGEAAGPDALLSVLVGVDLEADRQLGSTIRLLREAEQLDESAAEPARLRASLVGDPAPQATAALRDGAGYEALREVDARIAELELGRGFAEREPATWLVLYRLYLTRAIAELTAVVGDLDGAADDLLRASMMRPGAFLPRLLRAFLAWEPSTGIAALERTVDELVANGPEGSAESAAWLMLALAGRARPSGAELAARDLDNALRARLHTAATERLRSLGLELPELVVLPCKIENELLEGARQLLGELDEAGRAELGDRSFGRTLATQVGPESPLRAFHEVYARIVDPAGPGAADADGTALPPGVRLDGLERLLELAPQSWFVQALSDQVDRLFETGPAGLAETAQGVRVRAQLAAVLDEPEQALQQIQRWLAFDTADAEAYACRFGCHLRSGAVDEAIFDAALAQQHAADPEVMRARLRGRLARQLEGSGALGDQDRQRLAAVLRARD